MVKSIKKLIICNPYKKPHMHYQYDSHNNEYYEKEGRRDSGYQSMNEEGRYGMYRKIDSVNNIRPHVEKWCSGNYSGSTKTTKMLLDHWKNRNDTKLFFCQIEAIENIIYASEHPQVIDRFIHDDGGPFKRYCTKMATGTGKTIVMGMLIVWQVLNSGSDYTKDILVVTPNVTVRDRLAVLLPGDANNVYDEFDLVPAALRHKLSGARITITNFHQLKPKTSRPSSVAKLGTQGAKSFANHILGRAGSRNILVINDEGHHAWRPEKYTSTDSEETKNAGVWTAGLDMIHEARTIMRCHDFSATPFIPTGKSSTDETMFTWIISDFSLSDAIESGLVKTPQTPQYGEDFYHLYQQEDVSASLGRGLMPKPIKNAYKLLGDDWLRVNRIWMGHRSTPPVMITVCNNTKHAKVVADAFESNTFLLNTDLVKPESLLHIDSNTIKAISIGGGKDEIRKKVSTVGKPGEPGGRICNIVSVDMLTEGWDAKTVTHIMGLRAFKSQLLCEQVVGRGLRRTSYDTDKDGLFAPEHVCILGVPFAGLLSEASEQEGAAEPGPPPVEIYPNKPEHRVAWPIVIGIQDGITVRMDIKWDQVEPPQFYNTPPPASVKVGPVVDGWVADTNTKLTQQHRRQTIMYGILSDVMKNLTLLQEVSWSEYSPYNKNPDQITVDVLRIVREYIQRYIKTRLDEEGLVSMLVANRDAIAQNIFRHIVRSTPTSSPKADIVGTGSTHIPRKFTTKSRRFEPKKTHLNLMTADSDLELDIGRALDKDRRVISWAKSDMAGFAIPYMHPVDGTERNYKPDFVAHLASGVSLVLEGKGKEDDIDKAKNNALERWVRAVNADGRYGVWHSGIIYGADIVRRKLDDIVKSAESIPYTQTCQGCGVYASTSKESIGVFGLEKRQGILKIHKICKKCQKVWQERSYKEHTTNKD